MINRVVLVGRLTKDPDLRYTPSGIAVVRFTLAVNRQFTGGNGEKEADFINCIAWRKQAENLSNFQRKGALIGIEGRIQTGNYEGQDGKRVYTTDVVADTIQFLEAKREGRPLPAPPPEYSQSQQPQHNATPEQQAQYSYEQRMQDYQNSKQQEDPFNTGKKNIEVSEDDLPF